MADMRDETSTPETPHAPGLRYHWGRAPYLEIHALQERLVRERAEGRIPNVLLTGQHDPVLTLGRRTPADERPVSDLPIVEVERGGEATYHGPGQIVVYPIVHLTYARRDLHAFQRDLEEVGIRTLAGLGIEARRREGLTGVWVGDKKIQSLGIAVRRWVTWHGLALNVSTDLAQFQAFHPCGLDGRVMTSVEEVTGTPVDDDRVRDLLWAECDALLPGGPFVPGPLPTPVA